MIALFYCTALRTAIAIVVVGVVAVLKTFDETIAAGTRQRALIGMSVIAHITVFDATGGGTAITVGGITIIALFGVLSSTVTAVGARGTIGAGRTVFAKTLTYVVTLAVALSAGLENVDGAATTPQVTVFISAYNGGVA